MPPPLPSDPPALRASRIPRLIAALVFIAAVLPFLPALNNLLVAFDDNVIFAPEGFRGFSLAHLRWMFTTTLMGHYQPLTWVSYAIDYSIWGRVSPFGMHLTSLLLHGANAALLYLLSRRLLAAAWDQTSLLSAGGPSRLWLELAAATAALLFAVHPLRVESVVWATERRDILSTFFLLLAAIAYVRAFPLRSVASASLGWYIASIVLLLLSLLSKAWGMTFVAIALVVDWYPLRRLPGPPWAWLKPPTRDVLVQKIPFAVLGLATAAVANYAVQSIAYTALDFTIWPLSSRLIQSAYGLMFYAQKLVAPIHLAALYQLPIHQSLNQPRFVAGIVFAAAFGLAAVLSIRRWPAFAAAAAVYAIILAPVLGIRQAGPQLVADRYSYLANISWGILLAGAVAAFAARRRLPTAALAAPAAAVLALLSFLSWRQSHIWHDTETLFRHCIAVSDGSVVRLEFGRELSARDRTDEALEQFRRSTELDPRYGEAWFWLAQTQRKLQRYQEAEQSFLTARRFMADSWRADLMLGTMYIHDLDRPRDAAAAFQAAIQNVETPGMPNFSARPYLMMAAALDYLGDLAGERRYLLKAAEYPETRGEALEHLKELDAESGGR